MQQNQIQTSPASVVTSGASIEHVSTQTAELLVVKQQETARGANVCSHLAASFVIHDTRQPSRPLASDSLSNDALARHVHHIFTAYRAPPTPAHQPINEIFEPMDAGQDGWPARIFAAFEQHHAFLN